MCRLQKISVDHTLQFETSSDSYLRDVLNISWNIEICAVIIILSIYVKKHFQNVIFCLFSIFSNLIKASEEEKCLYGNLVLDVKNYV